MSPDERFAALVTEFADVDEVTPPSPTRTFGAAALRVRGKIFAMLTGERLVVKLPKPRVDALVDAGEGVRFDANKTVPMREWFSLDPASGLEWLPLAREALEFVGSR